MTYEQAYCTVRRYEVVWLQAYCTERRYVLVTGLLYRQALCFGYRPTVPRGAMFWLQAYCTFFLNPFIAFRHLRQSYMINTACV